VFLIAIWFDVNNNSVTSKHNSKRLQSGISSVAVDGLIEFVLIQHTNVAAGRVMTAVRVSFFVDYPPMHICIGFFQAYHTMIF